ncbi:hypothetical protein ZIOFF_018569 [Zingiber officinale]|uniref:Uncharacterized protein n=1 Tax=Zingiber officinale TaxID=94328 RepID=A0A8J5H678_ZINOF|nr:hypothetical protein ZIOFF_018569 [Zingiber officinale]
MSINCYPNIWSLLVFWYSYLSSYYYPPDLGIDLFSIRMDRSFGLLNIFTCPMIVVFSSSLQSHYIGLLVLHAFCLSSSQPRIKLLFLGQNCVGLLASLVFTTPSLSSWAYEIVVALRFISAKDVHAEGQVPKGPSLVIIVVYDSSIELLGDLLFKVAGTFGRAILELGSDDEGRSTEVVGTFGKAILEVGSDDEGPSTEAHDPIIIEDLGQRSRNEVLAKIYMTIFFSRLLESLEKQFLSLGVMTKVQAQRHMDGPAIIEVPGQRSRNEVLAEIYMVRSDINLTLHQLLEPLEKQFLCLGVMTKVQAQRHMDDPAIIEVLGQRSSDINLTLHQLCGISFYCVLFSCCHITILHNEFNVVVEHKRISYFFCLAALHVWKTIFFSRLLDPLEKQFWSLGVMTKVQAQRHMDDPAIIEVLGQRSHNEVLAEIYMVRSDINLTLHQLWIFLNKEGLMALQVAGTFGKAILEVGSDDVGPCRGTWMSLQLLSSLGKEVAMKFLLKFIWLLDPLEKLFLRLGVMTKVQALRHIDDPAIIEVRGQRSRNEVLAEIYMVRSDINLTLHQLCGISFYCVLFSCCHITILHNEFNVVVEHKRISYFLCLAALHVWKTIFFSRLLESLEKQFLSLGVMTKVQAQRHMDGPAIIEVLGQRSRNEVLAEIYMVRSDINLTLNQLCGIFVNKEWLMALQVARTFGKAILELWSDDEGIFVNKEGLMALQVAVTFGKTILELGSDDEARLCFKRVAFNAYALGAIAEVAILIHILE